MKTIERRIDGSSIILNPLRLAEIIKNSPHKAACGVLTPSDLVISTIALVSHTDTAEAAGIDLDDIFNDRRFRIGEKDLRLQITAEGVDVELWFFDHWSNADNDDYDNLPVTPEQMDELATWIKEHPKIRAAYGRALPAITLSIHDDASPIWVWEDGTLRRDGFPVPGL